MIDYAPAPTHQDKIASLEAENDNLRAKYMRLQDVAIGLYEENAILKAKLAHVATPDNRPAVKFRVLR